MPAKISTHVFKGMQKDINVANSSNEYLFDAHNLRFNLLDDNTLMSIVNERGNECILESGITGLYVSHYVVDNHIVVFTYDETNEVNIIYRIDVNEPNVTVHTLFDESDLNIRPEKPLEFTSYFEGKDVIKIYWVDGVNQLRFMNIMEELKNIANPNETPIYRAYTNFNDFNTTPELQLNETVIVELIDGNGLFPAGVIQYVLTYVNKLGAESNIFYTTKLHSILFKNRAASPQEYINCAFRITIKNVDTSFDYIRCYQLLRTSLDAQPTCLILNEVELESLKEQQNPTINIIDTNVGATYDPTALLFQKYPVISQTLDLKSNTLFLGNLEESFLELEETELATIKDYFSTSDVLTFTNDYGLQDDVVCYEYGELFSYKYNPDADIIRTFKSGEVYRIGIQLQDKYGIWTEPIYIKDLEVECVLKSDDDNIYPIYFKYTKPNDNLPPILNNYKRFRFLMVNPTSGDRTKLALGLVTPTMYELSDRIFNTPYAYSSWFARPFNSNVTTKLNALIPSGGSYEAEIQGRLLASDIDPNLKLNNDPELDWYTTQPTYDGPYTDDTEVVDDGSLPALIVFNFSFDIHDVDPNGGDVRIFPTIETCVIIKNNLNLLNNTILNIQLKPSDGYTAQDYTLYIDGRTYLYNREPLNLPISADIINALNTYANSHQSSLFYKYFFDGNHLSQVTQLTQELVNKISTIFLANGELNNGSNFTVTASITTTTEPILFDTSDYLQPSSGTSVFKFNSGELSEFRIDHSVLNLYSPDIDNLYYDIHNNPSLNLTLVGYSKVESLLDSIFILLKNAGSSVSSTVSPYFNFSKSTIDKTFLFARTIFEDSIVYKRNREETVTMMRDSAYLSTINAENSELVYNHKVPSYKFLIYPWHGAGSLNNEDNTEGEARSATYTKIFAKQWNCDSTTYYNTPYKYNSLYNQNHCNNFYINNITNNVTMIKLNNASKTYIGNPDLARTYVKLLNGIGTKENPIEFGYDIYVLNETNNTLLALDLSCVYAALIDSDGHKDAGNIFYYYRGNYDDRYPTTTNRYTHFLPIIHKVDPIQIKYNTDTHVIIPIDRYKNNNTWILNTLPSLSTSDDGVIQEYYYPLWDNRKYYRDIIPTITQDNNRILCEDNSYFHIGELERTGEILRYNGPINFGQGEYKKDDAVLISNVFIPIMESLPISSLNSTVKTRYGDTWYGRWDCLKTLHKTDLDELSVHDYVSIMVESHINLNGRYDSYRNFYDLTLVNALNANKFNDVYNQMDTFWSYKVIPNYLKTTYYPNQITWSLTKQTGALVDEWTRVTAANIQELDGNKGPINKILNYRDSLFVFQDRCISLIKYNEQTQMTTTEGVPVEISNSLKVTGIVKVYDGTGCINKWSIAYDANGIFFVDNANECIIWLGGSLDTPIVNLTSSKAFALFMKANNSFDVWNPESFSNFVTFIDSAHKDVYFVNADKCLCFSLVLLEFTSFYDYLRTFGMFNINNNFYSLYDKNGLKLYRNFTGKYNEIYGEPVETSFTFIDHGESFLTDKTFTNINYILDAYCIQQYDEDEDVWIPTKDALSGYKDDYDDVDYKYEPEVTFSTLRVWTPFLDTGDRALSDIQRKFRTWGILIERDLKYNITDVDRIRNNWAKFKFTFTLPDLDKDIKIELMNINILSIE